MGLLMSVTKQSVLGTRDGITNDCWNKIMISEAVLYLKMDHTVLRKDIIHINTGIWWPDVSCDVLGHPYFFFFFFNSFYIQHVALKQVQVYWQQDRIRHRCPSNFCISLCLIVQYLWKPVLLCRTLMTTSANLTLHRSCGKSWYISN